MEQLGAWAEMRSRSDGLIVPTAAHPTDPLTPTQSRALVDLFAGKPKILEKSWQAYEIERNEMIANAERRWGDSMGKVFMWDEDQFGSTLTVGQLTTIQSRGFPRTIIVNTRAWSTGVRDSINHPFCRGVMIEGQPRDFLNNTGNKLTIARHVLQNTDKPLFILLPPAHPYNTHGSHLEDVKDVVQYLRTNLPAYINSDRLVIVSAAYNVTKTQIPFLSEKNAAGTPNNNYSGGALYIGRNR